MYHAQSMLHQVQRKGHQIIKAEEESDDDLMEVAQAVGQVANRGPTINMSGARPAPKIKKEELGDIMSSADTFYQQPTPTPGAGMMGIGGGLDFGAYGGIDGEGADDI